MKQHGDGHWCGHRDITYAATARHFDRIADSDGAVRGMSRREYAEALDKAQAYQDRPLGAGVIRNFAGSGKPFPYVGPGPTAHSAYANPDAQAAHFMADPYRDGPSNLHTNTEYIYTELAAAQTAQNAQQEWMHLGAAVHALQDSYSGAHAWRDLSVYDGDPTAKVDSLHVFTPGHVVGLDKGRNTHADEFDAPPAKSGSTLAAIEATYRLLRVYERTRDMPPQEAELARRVGLDELFRPGSDVVVNKVPDKEWAAQRDDRLKLEHAGPGAQRSAELGQLRDVLGASPQPGKVSPGGVQLPADRPARSVSREIGSEAVGRDG